MILETVVFRLLWDDVFEAANSVNFYKQIYILLNKVEIIP